VETEAPVREHSGDASLDVVHLPTLFRGRGEYAIDDKGRLTLPAHMCKPLAEGGNLVVLDGRVVIWNESTYRQAADELNRQVAQHDLSQAHVRTFLSNTYPVAPDTQGRIVVPHQARVEAGLDRDVIVLGAGPRIEIVPADIDALDGLLGVDDSIAAALDRANF
jgi:MraZ protein